MSSPRTSNSGGITSIAAHGDYVATAGYCNQAILWARFDRAAGLVIASPEYNGRPSPYLKNTLD